MSIARLWRKGAGTPDDPNNGRLILRILGIHPTRWRRWRQRRWYAPDLRPIPTYWPRMLWNEATRYRYETCNRCGRQIDKPIGGTYWIADTDLYRRVVGHVGGTFCPACFTRAAKRLGIRVWWQPQADEEPA